jgi:hypothetical protein
MISGTSGELFLLLSVNIVDVELMLISESFERVDRISSPLLGVLQAAQQGFWITNTTEQ